MPPQQILRDTQGQPSVTFLVGSTPTNPSPDSCTVTITRGDGSAFGAPDQATADDGTGRFTYDLAPQSDLELFTFRWKATFGGVQQFVTTQVEIVGGFIVTLADLKAESGLGSKTDEELADARRWFERRAEEWCSVAFVPRYAFDRLDGSGNIRLDLNHREPRRLLSVKRDGTAETFTDFDLYERGFILRPSGQFAFGRKNYAVTYEHGLDGSDAALREAALTVIRSRVLENTGAGVGGGIPVGVTQLNTDAGSMVFGQLRRTRPFGIPEVDDVLAEHRPALVG